MDRHVQTASEAKHIPKFFLLEIKISANAMAVLERIRERKIIFQFEHGVYKQLKIRTW